MKNTPLIYLGIGIAVGGFIGMILTYDKKVAPGYDKRRYLLSAIDMIDGLLLIWLGNVV